jgi:hypothetical protein
MDDDDTRPEALIHTLSTDVVDISGVVLDEALSLLARRMAVNNHEEWAVRKRAKGFVYGRVSDGRVGSAAPGLRRDQSGRGSQRLGASGGAGAGAGGAGASGGGAGVAPPVSPLLLPFDRLPGGGGGRGGGGVLSWQRWGRAGPRRLVLFAGLWCFSPWCKVVCDWEGNVRAGGQGGGAGCGLCC